MNRDRSGFTFVEVMCVVLVMSLLAAIGGSSLSRHIRRSRTSEAVMNLDRMYESAVAYFNTLHATADGQYLPPQFPATAPMTPARDPDGQLYEPSEGNWDHPSWNALNFAMASPHRYQYGFVNLGDPGLPEGGGGQAFSDQGPFGSPGGPLGGGGPFGGGGIDGKPGASADKASDKPEHGAKGGTGTDPDWHVTICHVPSGNPANTQVITIGQPAVFEAHMENHEGDFVIGEGGSEEDCAAIAAAASEPDPEAESGDESEPDPEAEDNLFADPLLGTTPCGDVVPGDYSDGGSPGFYTVATGNLDDDTDYSFFYRSGVVLPSCEIAGTPLVMQENELE